MSEHIDRANYLSDPRVRARERGSPFRGVDMGKMKAVVVLEDDDGEEQEHEVPIRFDVCGTCQGRGTHVNPSVDANGLTADDFAEDPDFAEDYMGGAYDVGCYECKGHRVVPVIEEDRADKEVLKRLEAKLRDEADYRREVEAERRFGC